MAERKRVRPCWILLGAALFWRAGGVGFTIYRLLHKEIALIRLALPHARNDCILSILAVLSSTDEGDSSDGDHHGNWMAHGRRRIGRVVLRADQQGEAVDMGIYLGCGRHFLLGFIAYLCQRHPATRYAILLRIAGRSPSFSGLSCLAACGESAT